MAAYLRLILIAFLPFTALSAQTHVPQDLQDWQEWVLHDKEYLDCPFLYDRAAAGEGDFICAWPGRLTLSVDSNGGQFAQQWTVHADEQWVGLPGSTEYWPHQVTANGRSVEVVLHGGHPSVRLGPGTYRVAGSFEWDERPGVLHVPYLSGLVSLTVDGREISRPERNNSGLFLGERQRETQARDAVKVDVYRLVADDVPTRLVTRLRIDVSGGVREELFGPMLPAGFVPLAINSQLPARLEPDGKLRVQVRPGRWVLTLRARGPEVLNAIGLADPEVNMPGDEIWSYRSNDRLRVTAAEGLPPVDPIQVQVPDQWQQLPAFRIRPGETFTLTERSRGIVSAGNELSLSRTMWLDFDGDGFVVSDDIGGTMRTGWRLDMAPPYALLNASEAGENLLITEGDAEGESGIELRRLDVEVESLGRADTRKSMPVTGWDARFANVSATLNLPPGHKLFAAPGADRAPASWVSRWQLLDYFLVLIITIGTWRLFGRTAGIIALLALVLSYHESFSPSWLWLNLLVAVALLRVAPKGRLRRMVHTYQLASAVVLVLVLVPFIAGQLRIAIYPQLEPQAPSMLALPGVVIPPAPETEPAGMEPKEKVARSRVAAMDRAEIFEEIVVAAQKREGYSYARYAPNAIVQAGPGQPSWEWNSYRLNWSGPVDAEQMLRLLVLPRWAVTTLRFTEVIALLLFAAVFAAEILRRQFRLPGGLKLGAARAGSIVAAGTLAMLLAASPTASAQTPDPEILRELEARLTAAPDCVPRCAEVVAADVDIGPDNVSMRLTIHALEDVAIPLPGSDRGWRPDAVVLDGSAASEVMRGNDRWLWVRLAAGRHLVSLSGSVPAVDSLEIPFPAPPRVIEADSDGWFVAGIKDRRLLSGSLQLTRLQTDDSGDAALRWESSRFPAFVRIERAIDLDLDWRATTTVFRVAPVQGAVSLEVPLLEGETVLTEGIEVADGKALVSMNPGQGSVSWRSNLPRVSPLTLDAQAGAPWKETWWVGVGSIWHAVFSGVPESENPGASRDMRTAEFHPRGGESLTVTAMRPEASEGSTLAFDAVVLAVKHGDRSRDATLDLDYRSTRGAQHVIRLPEGAEVTEVFIDGELEPLRADAGALTVPILPGEHDIRIGWREAGDIGMRTTMPVIDIGAPASNITLNANLPRNRWLLATSGPKLGPAVLYWTELAVLILFALILGRVGLTPLRTHHWLLLGLGFSTFNWPVLGVVVAWLLACGAREKWEGNPTWWQFNLVQVVIGGATVIALMSIVSSLPQGLLGVPDMHVSGYAHYGGGLQWFADASESVLPQATAWSLPMWIYKSLILAWALWLSFALIRWLPWVWQCFSSRGFWKAREAKLKE
jgi:hypothetical protein